jgi:hypothetical protein
VVELDQLEVQRLTDLVDGKDVQHAGLQIRIESPGRTRNGFRLLCIWLDMAVVR